MDRPSAEWMSHPLAEDLVRCASAELKCAAAAIDVTAIHRVKMVEREELIPAL